MNTLEVIMRSTIHGINTVEVSIMGVTGVGIHPPYYTQSTIPNTITGSESYSTRLYRKYTQSAKLLIAASPRVLFMREIAYSSFAVTAFVGEIADSSFADKMCVGEIAYSSFVSHFNIGEIAYSSFADLSFFRLFGLWGPCGIGRVLDSGGVGHRTGRMGSRTAVSGDEGGVGDAVMTPDRVGMAWKWGER